MAWSDRDVEQLRELSTKHSAGEIGAIMGRTRNAVIAKLYRLGIWNPGDRVDARRVPRSRKRLPPKVVEQILKPKPPAKPKGGKPAAVAPDPLKIPVLDIRDGQCRWSVEELADRTHLFCGHKVKPGSSWCEFHHARATDPAPPRRL